VKLLRARTQGSGARGRLVDVRPTSDVEAAAENFETFYVREFASMVTLAFVLSGNRWVAEDLAQDAFLAAHRDWDQVGSYDRPGAWVRQVVIKRSASAFRRRAVEAKALARMALGQMPPVSQMPVESMDFWQAVRSLPRRQAQVITLHYLEDRPVAEIADILGTAEGTVKKHLHDGRQTLARRLDETEGGG
jgi:RNA polymerase sigma-70 factor (ECF subfamily)